MSFFIYADKFDHRHVHFGPVQCENGNSNNSSNSSNSGNNHNHINNNSKFSRITYSTNHISLNSVGFVLSDTPVASLVHVESAILAKYVLQLGETRRLVHSIASQTTDTTLAICGVWETRDECGLVYTGSK